MKTRTFCLVCIVLLTFLLPPPLYAGCYYDGNFLVKSMREYEKAEKKDRDTDHSEAWRYRGYVIGVHDATDFMYDIPEGVRELQICAIVAKFLKEHPEKWNEPASDLIIAALKEAFPKKK